MKTQRLRFDVFGRGVVVEATATGWAAFLPGNDGKRRPADFPIPANLNAQSINKSAWAGAYYRQQRTPYDESKYLEMLRRRGSPLLKQLAEAA